MALPGEQIFWTAALSFDPNDIEEVDHLYGQIRNNPHLSEEDSHLMPPHMVEGKIQGAVMVSQGTVVEAEEATQIVTLDPDSHSEETQDSVDHARVVGSDLRK